MAVEKAQDCKCSHLLRSASRNYMAAQKKQQAVTVIGKHDGTLSDKREENVKVVDNKDVPQPGEGEVLVRVKYR